MMGKLNIKVERKQRIRCKREGEEVTLKGGQRKRQKTLKVKAAASTNRPYVSVAAALQGAAKCVRARERDEYACFLSNVRLPAGCRLSPL